MSDAQAVRAEWSDGDYPSVGERLLPASEALLHALGPVDGVELLDVATGTGNFALLAAQAGADHVVGVDLTPELLEVARARADAAGLDQVEFVEGDAEALEFEEDRFDVVTSTFGVIFAPRPAVAAGELARVLTPGGRLGLTTWPIDSIPGQMAALVGRRMPHRDESRLVPPLWATSDGLHDLFAQRGIDLSIQRHTLHWRFADAAAAAAFAVDKVAGMRSARQAIGDAGIEAIRADLVTLFDERGERSADGLAIPFDYLLVRGVKTGA
jgi:ubiquinone/menaquinone biosynthesis C-methylase UbiE